MLKSIAVELRHSPGESTPLMIGGDEAHPAMNLLGRDVRGWLLLVGTRVPVGSVLASSRESKTRIVALAVMANILKDRQGSCH